MGLDIQYLLVLQKLREATGGVFDEVMNGISKFAVDVLPLLPFVIFWCFSRKWGYHMLVWRTDKWNREAYSMCIQTMDQK